MSSVLEKPLSQLERELAQVDLVTWTRLYRLTDKGEPFEFDDRSYLVQPMEDLSPHLVIQKASQVGATELAINRALWFADNHQVKVIYTFPTAEGVKTFSNSRLNPAIRGSPYLSRRAGGIDNVSLKSIGDSFVYFRGSWTERQAISIPSDFNIHDEIDFSKPDIKEMYQERLSASKFGWQLDVSTPRYALYGINALFEPSSQFHWFLRCPHCNNWINFCCGYPDVIVTGNGSTFYGCPKCKKEIDRRSSHKEWVAKYPDRSVKGYHISQTMCPWISAEGLLKKRSSYKYTKEFFNFSLGLPFTEESLPYSRDLLMSCIDNRWSMESRGVNCTMGIDQGDVLYVVISTRDGVRRRIVHLERIEEEDGFRRVERLMNQFDVQRCVIDALPNKNSARRLARDFPGRVYLCYYSDVQKDDIKWDKALRKVVVNRTESLDHALQKIIDREIIFPRMTEELNLLFEHLCNFSRDKREDKHGQPVETWIHIGDDHLGHANNYDQIAFDSVIGRRAVGISPPRGIMKSTPDVTTPDGLSYVGWRTRVGLPEGIPSPDDDPLWDTTLMTDKERKEYQKRRR